MLCNNVFGMHYCLPIISPQYYCGYMLKTNADSYKGILMTWGFRVLVVYLVSFLAWTFALFYTLSFSHIENIKIF